MKSKKIFESIYLKYYPALLVYGKNITNDEMLIEDAIQELFITLWKKQETLTIHSSFENYLFVAFRNNLIRKVKKNATDEITFDIIDIPTSNEIEEKEIENLSKISTLAPI